MQKKQDLKGQRRPDGDGLPQSLFSYLMRHEYASNLSSRAKNRARQTLEEKVSRARTEDPGRVPELVKSLEFVKELQNLKAPFEEEAGAFAGRIRRGEWDAIDRDGFADFLQQLSVAIRSRYDAPSAAAKDALRRIFDALSSPGPGRTYGWEGLKFDRLYRRGREAVLAEWLVHVEVKKELAARRRADEEFDAVQFLKERLGPDWAGRSSAIEGYIRGTLSPGARTKREMKKALGLNTRNKPKRRSPKPLR